MRPRRLLPLLLLLAAAPVPHPRSTMAPGAIALLSDTEARWVPFDLTPGNQIRFRLTVDGRKLTAVLDTGVSYSVIASSTVTTARLPVRAAGRAAAIGGAVPIGWVDTRNVALGGLVRRGGGFAVAELPAIATGSAEAVDVLVGRDLLGDGALDIDFAQHRFRVLRSGRMPFTGASTPLSISSDRLVYTGELTLGTRRLRPVVIDTGDGSAITVSEASWRAAGLGALRTTTAISFGLAGEVTSELAVAPELRTGQLVARNVEVRIEPAGGFSDAIGVAGRIGTGFLQNYRVLLDPRAGRMVLSPGPGADRPPSRSTSGLLAGLDEDRLRILHVMRGSPAAARGWKAGDEICRVDGQPIPADYSTSPLARWSIGAPGRTVQLGMCDGSTRPLTLAAFY